MSHKERVIIIKGHRRVNWMTWSIRHDVHSTFKSPTEFLNMVRQEVQSNFQKTYDVAVFYNSPKAWALCLCTITS